MTSEGMPKKWILHPGQKGQRKARVSPPLETSTMAKIKPEQIFSGDAPARPIFGLVKRDLRDIFTGTLHVSHPNQSLQI